MSMIVHVRVCMCVGMLELYFQFCYHFIFVARAVFMTSFLFVVPIIFIWQLTFQKWLSVSYLLDLGSKKVEQSQLVALVALSFDETDNVFKELDKDLKSWMSSTINIMAYHATNTYRSAFLCLDVSCNYLKDKGLFIAVRWVQNWEWTVL